MKWLSWDLEISSYTALPSMVKDLKALNSDSRSGHSVIMGRVNHDWQDTNYVLARFGDSVKEARKSYLRFVRKAIDQGRRPDCWRWTAPIDGWLVSAKGHSGYRNAGY